MRLRYNYLQQGEAIMNIQPNQRMSKAAFIGWGATEEERYELVGGRVVMMPRPSLAHGLIVGNLYVALRNRLDRKQWVVIQEYGLDAGPETLRYPDIVVDRAGGRAKAYTAMAPVLLAEVLSPSSVEIDLGDKRAEYLQIPSLLAYVVLSQDEPSAWIWTRKEGGFKPEPEILDGAESIIRVAALKVELPLLELVELPLLELYADVEFG
jgi:Uma2 family endonuclease